MKQLREALARTAYAFTKRHADDELRGGRKPTSR